ncbi:MAG: hypothetical protein V2I33_26240 [Kangiellaceae bacterium]|jgi:hypothetical protein|nr:hypothetical protein [Kangiellaceae bacterium]
MAALILLIYRARDLGRFFDFELANNVDQLQAVDLLCISEKESAQLGKADIVLVHPPNDSALLIGFVETEQAKHDSRQNTVEDTNIEMGAMDN